MSGGVTLGTRLWRRDPGNEVVAVWPWERGCGGVTLGTRLWRRRRWSFCDPSTMMHCTPVGHFWFFKYSMLSQSSPSSSVRTDFRLASKHKFIHTIFANTFLIVFFRRKLFAMRAAAMALLYEERRRRLGKPRIMKRRRPFSSSETGMRNLRAATAFTRWNCWDSSHHCEHSVSRRVVVVSVTWERLCLVVLVVLTRKPGN